MVGGVVLVAAIGAVVAREPLLGWVVEQRASSMGVTLRFDQVSVGWGSVKVSKARFGLREQNILTGEADSLTFDLGLLGVRKITADRARLALIGALPDIASGLSRWRSAHGKGDQVKIAGTSLALEARDTAQSAPWLQVTGVSASPAGKGGVLQAQSVAVFGAALGPQLIGWATSDKSLDLWLGGGNEATSHSRLSLLATSTPTARITLSAAPLASLAAPLGLPSAQGASVDLQAELLFPSGQGLQGKMSGALRGVSLGGDGWSGLVLGTQTTFASQLVGTPDGSRVQFQRLTVQSGGLSMQGAADFLRQPGASTLKGRLDGAVACGMLAHNAASAAVGGGALGGLLGAAAGAAVGGTVTISVGFDFDTHNPRAGAVRPVIGVGCALRVP